VSYEFEWDHAKAGSNLEKHGVSFEEAVTVFADPLSLNMPDPAHSADEKRFLVLGMSTRDRLLVVAYAERPPRTRLISAREATVGANAMTMKKAKSKAKPDPDRDTLQPEYDFSKAVRGTTAARYAKGTNVVILDPELRELFPTSEAVNEALRELAAIAKRAVRVKRGRRSA
jgi:hypothetical protein